MQLLVQRRKFLQEIPVASSAFSRRKLRRQKVFTVLGLLSPPLLLHAGLPGDLIPLFLIVRRSRTLCRIVLPLRPIFVTVRVKFAR